MTLPSWKRKLTLAALVVAPVLTGGGAALAMPAGPPPGAGPAAADVQKATALFMKATELFKAKKFVPALDHFKQSYALVPSPNSHLYIARCLAALGEARGAWLEFDHVIDEAAADGAKYVPTRESATQERDDLGGKLSLVTVVVQNPDPAMTVRVGTHDVPPDRWGKPYPVEPGNADVTVQAPGKPAVRQTVNVAPGERREVAINTAGSAGPIAAGPTPGPVAPPSRHPLDPLRVGAFVAGGVGVVGFALFAAGGALSSGTYSTINTACGGVAGCPHPAGLTPAAVAADISSGKSQQALANAGLTVGVLGIAAGATLFVLSMRKHPGDSGQPTADLVVGPSWAGAVGSF